MLAATSRNCVNRLARLLPTSPARVLPTYPVCAQLPPVRTLSRKPPRSTCSPLRLPGKPPRSTSSPPRLPGKPPRSARSPPGLRGIRGKPPRSTCSPPRLPGRAKTRGALAQRLAGKPNESRLRYISLPASKLDCGTQSDRPHARFRTRFLPRAGQSTSDLPNKQSAIRSNSHVATRPALSRGENTVRS